MTHTILLILMLAIGLVLIVKGGDTFVEAASWMATASGIPQFIIGATIVSLATTLPEQLVSAIAAMEGSVDMAIGNAVGSVTANTALILAVALLAMPGPAPRRTYLGKSVLLIACTIALTVLCRGGILRFKGSLALIVLFLCFLVENLHSAKKSRERSDDRPAVTHKAVAWNLLLFALGTAGIVCGAELLVDSAQGLARLLGVPEIVIAVTIVAVGTSLPELVTTLTAIAKRQTSLSAGNIIGANIIDASLILPLCSFISGQELPVNAQSAGLDIPIACIVTLVALVPPLVTQKFYRWQGALLLAIYLGYLSLILF